MSHIPPGLAQIRYQNLLVFRKNADSVSDFARKCGISQAQASQLTSANDFKPMGEKLARKIEAHMNLERGWLDQKHGDQEGAQVITTAVPKPKAPTVDKPKDNDSVSLVGLSLIQRAMVTKAAELCENGYLDEKACLLLLTSWQDLGENAAR